jgi:glycosyltransferase involved in cell wall biosynthesis
MEHRPLFIAHGCYLDDSNGAAVASRALMEGLVRLGLGCEALTGSALEIGREIQPDVWFATRGIPFEINGGGSWTVDARGPLADVPIHYRLTERGVTVTLYRCRTSVHHTADAVEREEFLRLFEHVWKRFRPDIVVNYGGDRLAHEIRSRARARGAAVVFALHNFNYPRPEPFATADVVIVPSRFAADHYRKTLGLDCVVLPNLVDVERVRVLDRDPRCLTFVNPSYEKGVYVFARIADELGRRRPDIPLLVVESRGTERILADCGLDLRVHGNVFLMDNTPDPRAFWGVTRLCVMPSLWWENQPLVAIEAMINGVPVIGSDRGGIPETLGQAGVVLPLPDRLTPTTSLLPSAEEIEPWLEAIVHLWDDAAWYEEQRQRALAESKRWSPEELEPRYVEFFSNLRSRPDFISSASST